MGFIRGTAITFFSIVLLISLFLMNLCLIVSWSLEHDTLKPALEGSASNILKDFLTNSDMFSAENQAHMKNYCSIDSEFKFTYENYNFTFPCQVIENGPDSIVSYGSDYFIDTIYYAEYNCEFWQCVKNSSTVPFVLFSEKAMDYWRGKFLLLLALSFLIFALIFFISKNRPLTLIITGVLLIFSVFPFRKLSWVLTFIPEKFLGLFSVFFTKAHAVFVIILIIGIIFIGIGLAFRLFGWSMNLIKKSPEDSEKEVVSKSELREIVKEEISKKGSSKKREK